ncbi:ABC transporter ATP-binding protein [Micromonospora olivasterospora]|uniref:ATP-binding cassette subfamily B protein n=1 Tax=Micromonospora olivasterospora TaxID=1880 RepID=A0A562IHV0_MICOL|nr:ABC transporter ATP-binding protein [Micromonospora olivasterospora]TWH70396.1 ATP-binding cassette subfamily B protein [Micromonospora olivasterospora]
MSRRPPAPAPGPGALARVRAAATLTARAAPLRLTGYAGLTLLGGTLPVLAAWLTKLVLDGLVRGAALTGLAALAGALALAGLLTAAVPQLTEYLRAELDRAAGLRAHDRLFRAVAGFVGLRRFEEPGFLDRLRLAQQSGGTSPMQAVDGVLGVSRAALTIAGFLGSLLVLSPPMTGLVLVAAAPTVIAEVLLARRRARMLWAIGPTERREFFYRNLLSTVEAAKEIRLFDLGRFLRGRMLADRRRADAARRAVDRRELVVQGGLGLLAAAVSGAGVVWAVAAARRGALSVGDVTVFVAAVAGVQSSLVTMARELARGHQAMLLFDHYLAVTTAPPDLPLAGRPDPLPPLRGGIELRDVWFRYSAEHPWVLRGVDLRIPYGATVALVGLNGAGKSTLVKLLCRFYDPTRGSIRWDGLDLRRADPAELRRRIGAVFQDYMHYDLTAHENIALGDLDAIGVRDRVERAAARAGVHRRLTELPDGYDTLLSRAFFLDATGAPDQPGVELSEGQWQRLALARALMRDRPELLILDEPSAGLDAEAEQEIHRMLRRHRAGRTSLLVSHRLNTVRDADLIVVLAGGRVIEQGDHATLTALGGEYARLFRLQSTGYRDTAPGLVATTGEH